MLPTFLLTLVVISFVFVGVGIRMFLIKGGEFRGSCAQNNPMLKTAIGECTVCGKMPGEECKGEEKLAMQ